MKVKIIGIGNPILRDDSVGIKIAERLRGRVNADVEILMTTDFEVIDKILGYDKAIIVDAVKSGKEPGTIYEFSLDDVFSSYSIPGTHALSLGTTLKLGYTIFPEEMPKELKIFAVEVEDIEHFGEDCTPKVERAIPKVIEMIEEELKITQTPKPQL